MKNYRLLINRALLAFISLAVIYCGYKIVRWRMYVWLPDYLNSALREKNYDLKKDVHIIFLIVDHYEPGSRERGVLNNKEWLEQYKTLADRHVDSYGRKLQHTWFYAYDQLNDGVMNDLKKSVVNGYGEVEFHWHHKHDDNLSFQKKIDQAIAWFNKFGFLIDKEGRTAFGFIHGNWSLDNAKGDNFCGVNRELDILKSKGCFADFTFPAFGDLSQPRTVNKIYYAVDDDNAKSYDTGVQASVGKQQSSGLMIFQGPISLLTYGAIEKDPFPNVRDIDRWVEANIHVEGQPNWIFIKAFTHGIQSMEAFFSEGTDSLLSYLESKYSNGPFKLHYVTAREAYNIVKAAEDGLSDDPDKYLDYEIKMPQARQ